MFKTCLSLVLLCCVVGSKAIEFKPVSELPADIPTCSQKDLNINECIRSGLQAVMPRLKEGIEALNIPPLDPLVMEKFSSEYQNGVFQGRISMRNVRVEGLSEMQVKKIDFELEENRIRFAFALFVPKLYVEGSYKADIKLNNIKITPKGYFNISMSDVALNGQADGELYERDGHTYLTITKTKHEPDIGDMRIYASGLLPDPALSAALLEFINQNWRSIYKAVWPETSSMWEPIIMKRANEFFAALPFDLIVPKN